MNMLENLVLLEAIASTSIFPVAVVQSTFNRCKSYDDTILLCEIGARNSLEPLTVLETLNKLNVSVKHYYQALYSLLPKEVC